MAKVNFAKLVIFISAKSFKSEITILPIYADKITKFNLVLHFRQFESFE